ncbi:MAG: S6e family ribosomal protein [Thermoproteota archaeon]
MPAKFKCIISDPKTGKSQVLELEGDKARPLIGLKIGDSIDGSVVGLSGKLKLTGGVDRSGFPMKKGVHGAVKARLLIKSASTRRRSTVRGEIVSEDSYQLNFVKVVEEQKGKKDKDEKEEVVIKEEAVGRSTPQE